jgi:LysR family hydrogen peroxide-inducible transcriptional activator
MELHQLKYFVAAAESGNVTRAAARCHVAQPSMSQQIKKLEDDLGVSLFDRLGRGIVLTDAGRALLPRARRIMSEVRETEANLKREADDCHGMLMVGAIPTMAPYLLPPAVGRLRAEHPECQVSVREDLTENLVEALADNEIDCALVSTPLQHELLEVEVLADEELLVVVPSDHPAAGRKELSPQEISGQPTITLEEMHCLGRQIQGFCATRRIVPRVICRTTQLSTIIELVVLGMGVSLVPEMAAKADRSGRCRYLRVRPGKPVRQIGVAWRRGRVKPRAAVHFVQTIAGNLRHRLHSLDQPRSKRSK